LSVAKKVFRADTENYNANSVNINILDLINQSLVNGLIESTTSDDSLVFKIEPDEAPPLEVTSPTASTSKPVEEVKKVSTSTSRMFRYLLECYNRVAYEERTQPKVQFSAQ